MRDKEQAQTKGLNSETRSRRRRVILDQGVNVNST